MLLNTPVSAGLCSEGRTHSKPFSFPMARTPPSTQARSCTWSEIQFGAGLHGLAQEQTRKAPKRLWQREMRPKEKRVRWALGAQQVPQLPQLQGQVVTSLFLDPGHTRALCPSVESLELPRACVLQVPGAHFPSPGSRACCEGGAHGKGWCWAQQTPGRAGRAWMKPRCRRWPRASRSRISGVKGIWGSSGPCPGQFVRNAPGCPEGLSQETCGQAGNLSFNTNSRDS